MFQHKVSNVEGGNNVATIMVQDGKMYSIMTHIPQGHAKKCGTTQKKVLRAVFLYNEQALRDKAATK